MVVRGPEQNPHWKSESTHTPPTAGPPWAPNLWIFSFPKHTSRNLPITKATRSPHRWTQISVLIGRTNGPLTLNSHRWIKQKGFCWVFILMCCAAPSVHCSHARPPAFFLRVRNFRPKWKGKRETSFGFIIFNCWIFCASFH